MINRRDMTKGLAAITGSIGMAGLSNTINAANQDIPQGTSKTTKRVIFFMQNQGFEPETCIPETIKENCPLSSIKLAEPMAALEPYKDKMHVIMGLHGRHTSPSHSAYFGALGGYRGGIGVPPAAPTIDHVISQRLPQTILPHLCIGMDSIENMKARPTLATLSATGPAQPIFMHSDPNKLYQMLFGSIASGDVYKRYKARSKVFTEVEKLAALKAKGLPMAEAERYAGYINGFKDMNGLRKKLVNVSEELKKVAPKYDKKYPHPEFETDWHDRLLDIGIAALQANLTNVLTIGSGRGEIFGSWKGIGVEKAGHNLGHMKQAGDDIWIKIRQYNTQMLIKLMKSLEAIPEGNGTMMDNTFIVYTSNNGAKQHTNGDNWSYVLLGNGGGQFKTGQYTYMTDKRPLNDLYTTFLHGIGTPVDRFNMSNTMAARNNSKVGPIEGILA